MRPLSIAILVFVTSLVSAAAVAMLGGKQDHDAIVSALDEEYGAACWMTSMGGIDCLPLAQLQGQTAGSQSSSPKPAGISRRDIPSLAGDPVQNGPTPARSPAPRQHHEVFQL